jgi:hypothetical protein
LNAAVTAAGRGFLILSRKGVLWGVDNAAVAGLTRNREDAVHESGFRVEVGGRPLAADDVLGVVDTLRIWPLAPAVRRFCPGVAAGVSGMSVHGASPLLVVDSRQPPRLLWLEEGEGTDEGRE